MSKKNHKGVDYVIAGLLLVVILLFSYSRKQSLDTITFCTVTKFNSNSLVYSRLTYEYEVNGTVYEYSKRKEYSSWIREGEKYILVYRKSDPAIHNPIFSIKFKSYIQLDSLTHEVGIDKLGSVWHTNMNNAHVKK